MLDVIYGDMNWHVQGQNDMLEVQDGNGKEYLVQVMMSIYDVLTELCTGRYNIENQHMLSTQLVYPHLQLMGRLLWDQDSPIYGLKLKLTQFYLSLLEGITEGLNELDSPEIKEKYNQIVVTLQSQL